MKERSIAVLGDVLDVNVFGGAPRQFFEAAKRQGFAQHAEGASRAASNSPRRVGIVLSTRSLPRGWRRTSSHSSSTFRRFCRSSKPAEA